MKTLKIDKAYDPHPVEEKWYSYWLEKDFFKATPSFKRPGFSMVIPPPNITGSLHMGHALNNTLQDILARYKRMDGFDVLWLPGTDHAGIATQNVVEKDLHESGLDRHAIGRKSFEEKVWTWREKFGGIIINQLKKLGATCDWSRERFTLDEGLSRAVREVFVRLYEEELIYRDNYIINWCPRCHTALSDLEAEHEDIKGGLYHIRYPLSNKDGEGLVIATTRPETMLGDTAVAVHPDDERYKDLVGAEAVLPLVGRKIPIIADSHVDPSFGTGALKITPAHDPNDFEIGLRHGLQQVTVIGREGTMTGEAGHDYIGMDRFKCREKVLNDLEKKGCLIEKEEHVHSVGHCYRCKTIVEPLISLQWFVKTKPLAEQAIQAVKEGKTKIVPKGWENTYFRWMEDIRDWCISRQIWWGHRIPVWYCGDCFGKYIDIVFREEVSIPGKLEKLLGGTYSKLKRAGFSHDDIIEYTDSYIIDEEAKPLVSKMPLEACPDCLGKNLLQDPDVLDTWFSSALWPFSTMGWPDETDDLKAFYPTAVLVTGFDIIFFWVARMMMMGLKFMNEVPFKDVYIHALVRDAEGQKMSKSKGNVIDPLLMMDQFGTDALRFTLAAFAVQGRDVKLSPERIEVYRNFCNKIWNVARFTSMNLDGSCSTIGDVNPENYSLADRWVLSRFNHTVKEVRKGLDEYRFNDAAHAIYRFIWNEFCDWHIEIIKPDLRGERGEERQRTSLGVLLSVLMESLKLLHPFMPFITEEIRSVFLQDDKSIMIDSYPDVNDAEIDDVAEDEMDKVIGTVKSVRNFRSEHRIKPSMILGEVFICCKELSVQKILETNKNMILDLSKVSSFSFDISQVDIERSARLLFKDIEIFLPLTSATIQLEEEEDRLRKKTVKLEKELSVVEGKLGNKDFLTKAPREVVEKAEAKAKEMKEALKKINDGLDEIAKMKGSRKKENVQN